MNRFELAIDVTKRVPRLKAAADQAIQHFHDKLHKHKQYIVRRGEDMPEIRQWKWQ